MQSKRCGVQATRHLHCTELLQQSRTEDQGNTAAVKKWGDTQHVADADAEWFKRIRLKDA